MNRIAGLLTAVFLIILLVVGFALDRAAIFARMRNHLHSKVVPTALLNRGKLGAVIRELGLVHPIDNDNARYCRSLYPRMDMSASLFQKKGVVGPWLYEVNSDWLHERRKPPVASSDGITPADLKRDCPAISINVDEADLSSDKWGIVYNYGGRGREWERLAHVSYYDEKGAKRFSSYAGIRLHGMLTRHPGNTHSYRLYFDEEYESPCVPAGVIFSPEYGPLRRIVVHSDWPEETPFTSCLAMDIAERIGCVVPEAKPAELFLNGKSEGVYFLAENIRSQWKWRMGHSNFLLYECQTGINDENAAKRYEPLHDWARNRNHPLTLADAFKRIDVESLSRYILTIAFCGTTDGFQGMAIMNLNEIEPRWSWIVWDLDHSFWDWYGRKSGRKIWEQESWLLVFKRPGYRNFDSWNAKRGDVRAVIFGRLMDENPEYRRYFLRLVMDTLNHRITDRFLSSRVDYYEKLARSFGIKDMRFIQDYREFMSERPAVVSADLKAHWNVPDSVQCDVKGTVGSGYVIDGYPEDSAYKGWYLKGETITVEPAGDQRKCFSHWLVNGQKHAEPILIRVVQEPTTIEAVFSETEHGAR